MKSSICITGMGALSGIGLSVRECVESLRFLRPAIRPLRYLQTVHSDIPVSEIPLSDDDLRKALGIPDSKIITRTSLIAIYALRQALSQAGIITCNSPGGLRIGLISGNTVGGMEQSEKHYLDFINPQTDAWTPYIDAHDCGACSDKVADYFGGFSYVTTCSTACSSGSNAIVLACMLINAGVLDIVAAGGTECLSKFHLNGFNSLMILDKQSCKPFDANRKGINLGEGAAYVILESEENARLRGVKPLARISGWGNACDAYHQTATSPDGEGPYLAMKRALESSGLQASDIEYVNAHGTGTGNNDLSELRAMERIFGTSLPPFSSTKAFTGHTTSAAGALETVLCAGCMLDGFLPANLNFQEAIEQCPHIPITATSTCRISHLMNNSFGFGGNNTSIILSAID